MEIVFNYLLDTDYFDIHEILILREVCKNWNIFLENYYSLKRYLEYVKNSTLKINCNNENKQYSIIDFAFTQKCPRTLKYIQKKFPNNSFQSPIINKALVLYKKPLKKLHRKEKFKSRRALF